MYEKDNDYILRTDFCKKCQVRRSGETEFKNLNGILGKKTVDHENDNSVIQVLVQTIRFDLKEFKDKISTNISEAIIRFEGKEYKTAGAEELVSGFIEITLSNGKPIQ